MTAASGASGAVLPHRFYLVVDDVRWIERLLPIGLRFVQLRLKGVARAELSAQIAAARDLCAAAGATLVVNDYWDLALALGCDFIHLGQEDLDAADLDAIRAAGPRLGVSTHDHAELARALALAPTYVALGPVYFTTLKAMRWDPQGLDRVGEWRGRVAPTPLVAIGGITLERGRGVFTAGADCIAVVSDVLKAEDPEARLRGWLALAEGSGDAE